MTTRTKIKPTARQLRKARKLADALLRAEAAWLGSPEHMAWVRQEMVESMRSGATVPTGAFVTYDRDTRH
jgi:hypothetical protein